MSMKVGLWLSGENTFGLLATIWNIIYENAHNIHCNNPLRIEF